MNAVATMDLAPSERARRELSPWYAGLLWSLAVPFVGSWMCTIVVSIPFIALGWALTDDMRTIGELEIRALQMVQIPTMYLLGSRFAVWYFPRRYRFDPAAAKPHMLRFRFIPFLMIGLGSIGPALAMYGDKVGRALASDPERGAFMIRHMVLVAAMLILWDLFWALRTIPSAFARMAARMDGGRLGS